MPSSNLPSLRSARPCCCRARASKFRIAEALADLGSLGGNRAHRRVIAGGLLAQCGWQPQIALLDAVAPDPVHQALRAGEPAAGAAHLSPGCEMDPQPEGGAGGRQRLVGVPVGAMGALQSARVSVVVPGQVGGRRQQLEVGRSKRRLISCREGLVCVAPCSPFGVPASPLNRC